MMRCCIPGCRSNYERTNESVEVFQLPREMDTRKLWLRFIPAELHRFNPVVCVKHFANSCLVSGTAPVLVNGEVTLTTRTKLKPGSYPTIFPKSMVSNLCGRQQVDSTYYRQGGNVVLPQGAPGVSGTIDMIPTASSSGMSSNSQMRGGPSMPFLAITDQMRARSNQFLNVYGGYPQQPPKINYTPQPAPPPPAPPAPPAPPVMSTTTYTDVKFKKLPFFDTLSEILKPSPLSITVPARDPSVHFSFTLTPKQATDVSFAREVGPNTKNDYLVQVQMRFCVLDNSADQEDCFPPGCAVKINGKPAQLPNPIQTNKQGAEPKRPPRPVNISSLVKLAPLVNNTVLINWSHDYQRNYVVCINVVRRLTSTDLLDRLRQKGVRPTEYTAGLIKDKLNDSDNEIATTSLRVTLVCPLGKMRMKTPVRSTTCGHLQCFDGTVFLSMNEKRPTWSCPVCNKPALYDSLVIDGYFQNVLESPLLGDNNEIELHKDGSWSVHDETKEAETATLKSTAVMAEDDSIQEIKDDDEEDVSAAKEKTTAELVREMVTVDLTETDDEDGVPRASTTPITIVVPPKATTPVTTIIPPPAKATDLYSDSTTTSSLSTTTRSPTSSIINLDSPSPSPPLPNYVGSLGAAPTSVGANSFIHHVRPYTETQRYHPY